MATRTDIPISAPLAEILGRCEALRRQAEQATDEDAPSRVAFLSPRDAHQAVDAAELEHWETTHGTRFPRDLLALEALGVGALRRRVVVPLVPLALEKTYRQKLTIPKGFVVVGAARGAGHRESVAIQIGDDNDANPALLVLSASGKMETTLVDLLELRLEDLKGWTALPKGAVPTDIRPVIVNWAGSAALGRRVSHKKFGGGTVRKQIEGASADEVKLEIEFDDVGVKVLLARFVTEESAGDTPAPATDASPRLTDAPFREVAKATASRLGLIIAPDFIKALSSVPRSVFAEKLYWKILHPGLWQEAGEAVGDAGWLEDMSMRTDSVRDGRYRGPPGIAIGRAAGGEILCLVAKNKRGGGPLERLAQLDHESLELEPVGGTFGSAEDIWNVLRESGILSLEA